MAFRKRNTVIRAPMPSSLSQTDCREPLPGTRPSPLDGRLTTSTGTFSLDQLLAGHAGLPLGSSLLIEESGTTDFGGILLRYFAGEGLVQGHQVHVLGVGDAWRRELPGLVQAKEQPPHAQSSPSASKMKIAWRYETLGSQSNNKGLDAQREAALSKSPSTFCHSFDLSKRLGANCVHGRLLTYPTRETAQLGDQSFFPNFISELRSNLKASSSVHRVIIPNMLSPAAYPATACKPDEVLRFLHSLQSLLRQFPSQLAAVVSLPISLHPRHFGLCKWMELLSDGVVELVPLKQPTYAKEIRTEESKAQGLVRVHKLPIFHEKGGGMEGCWKREDMSFRLSASNGLVIMPFSLPPVGLDEESRSSSHSEQSKIQDLNF
ncbi:Elongator subunit elp4 [Metarhizium acridum]|nr:Elongator subunit elp4 [Metarhizium acridum]